MNLPATDFHIEIAPLKHPTTIGEHQYIVQGVISRSGGAGSASSAERFGPIVLASEAELQAWLANITIKVK